MSGTVIIIAITIIYFIIKTILKSIQDSNIPGELEEDAPPLLPKDQNTKILTSESFSLKPGEEIFCIDGKTVHKIIYKLSELQRNHIENSTLKIAKSNVYMHYPTRGQQNIDHQEKMNRDIFFWNINEEFDSKSLPDTFMNYESAQFVIKNIPDNIESGCGQVVPWFGKPGGGTKYFFMENNQYLELSELAQKGYIQYLSKINTMNLNHAILSSSERYVIRYDENCLNFESGNFILDGKVIPMWVGFEIGRMSVFEI